MAGLPAFEQVQVPALGGGAPGVADAQGLFGDVGDGGTGGEDAGQVGFEVALTAQGASFLPARDQQEGARRSPP